MDALAGISIKSTPTNNPLIPKPKSILSKGPPIHAARAINGYPIFVITIHDTKSPTELPSAKIVIPSADGRIYVRLETKLRIDIIWEAIIEIQDMDTITPNNEIRVFTKVKGFEEWTRL